MAVTHTSASDYKDFLEKLKTFAVANGWTLVYDGLNDSDKWQMGLSKGNCHISIGAQLDYYGNLDASETHNFAYYGTTITDTRICLSLATSLTPTRKRYYGHTGQVASGGTDTDDVAYVNDLHGSFSDVWFFTNHTGDYIHCAVLIGDRYTTFSFGNNDVKGMGIPAVGYAGSCYYEFWAENTSNLSSSSYDPNRPNADHRWFLARKHYAKTSLHGLLLGSMFDPSDPLTSVTPFVSQRWMGQFYPAMSKSSAQSAVGEICPTSFFPAVKTQPTTGGIPLYSAPMIYGPYQDTYRWMGELPDLRLVDISTLTPGSDISYAGENWTVFPWKRKGLEDESGGGNNPRPEVNTINFGVAYKKIT